MEPVFHALEDFSVRFAETDAAGVVHFTHFLRWAENAEGDFFRSRGLKLFEKTAAGTRFGYPRVAVRVDYRAPARYADRIRAKIRPRGLPPPDARSVDWKFEIFRVESDGAETLLAEGGWTSVPAEIDAGGNVSPRAVPEELREALRAFF